MKRPTKAEQLLDEMLADGASADFDQSLPRQMAQAARQRQRVRRRQRAMLVVAVVAALTFFHRYDTPAIPLEAREKACRFYQINPYLKNYSIESITTAIETGWKMLNIADPPTIRFHKDTGLLIAVENTTN